ncbi:hypothetical protein P8452_74841 [Trifolium repens]|nr:hypothetical protein P8452_74841 [Trifolium repens]
MNKLNFECVFCSLVCQNNNFLHCMEPRNFGLAIPSCFFHDCLISVLLLLGICCSHIIDIRNSRNHTSLDSSFKLIVIVRDLHSNNRAESFVI